jgi:GTP diphosphokinase / guanosine-3',5'-bis(diphosphate) 3'-diphosphatase
MTVLFRAVATAMLSFSPTSQVSAMMRQYELVERVLSYDPDADENLLNRAYVYAMKAHANQQRASGDPYFSHPLEVAAILTDLHLDSATIATALLHDVIEDTDATRAEIDDLFGSEIGQLVDGLTKIKRIDLVTKKAEQAENFRKLLIAISSDIRVLLVKLADRLHNMRTMEYMKPASRARISEETLEIYAPLAGRMGIRWVVEELQDHAFRWLYPEAYKTVTSRLEVLRARNKGLIEEIGEALRTRLDEEGIYCTIDAREKKPYMIWRKMENRQISLEQLSDIYGFRVLTERTSDCYRVVGVAHTAWRAVPGRFKDYISTPKQNGYQSLHTTVVGPRHQRVELQVRTNEMHSIAELGVASHILYKEHKASAETGLNGSGATMQAKDIDPYMWLRRLVATLLDGPNPEEFLEHTKLELFHDQVFCFSPKGRLIALPTGATPIDFAYSVHTDVGNMATGALINGRQMPMSTRLTNGDEVEILTDKQRTPPSAWERVAVTGRARAAIRRAAREALRRQYVELGRRLTAAHFERVQLTFTDDLLEAALPRLSANSVEEALVDVGRGELPAANILKAVAPEKAAQEVKPAHRPRNSFDHGRGQDGWFNLARVIGLKFRASGRAGRSDNLPIRGMRHDLPVTFDDSGAVPGDRIVGVLVPGSGIKIFQIHSPKLRGLENNEWIDVTWDIDSEHPERFPARLNVTAANEPGSLAQIAQLIGENDGNIDNVQMKERAADFTEMSVEVEVWDLEHLNRIIAGLRSRPVVSKVERLFE